MYESLILAAGYGTRLRPYTTLLPKPLIPFFGCPILWTALVQIRETSLNKIYINGHHLAHKIEDFIKQLPEQWQEQITFHYEPEILGTGGPIAKANRSCQQQNLLIYNSDCLHNISLNSFYKYHLQGSFHASMVLLAQCPPGKNPVYARAGRVIKIGQDEQLEQDPEVTRHTLAGVHIVDRAFRELIPENQFFDVRKIYEQLISSSRGVGAFIYDGPWFDIGEPHDYWLAHETILTSPMGESFLEQIGVFDYLHSRNWQPDFNFGPTAPRYFDLTGHPEHMGDLTVNLSQEPIDLRQVQQVLLLPEQTYHSLNSRHIYGHSFHFPF